MPLFNVTSRNIVDNIVLFAINIKTKIKNSETPLYNASSKKNIHYILKNNIKFVALDGNIL